MVRLTQPVISMFICICISVCCVHRRTCVVGLFAGQTGFEGFMNGRQYILSGGSIRERQCTYRDVLKTLDALPGHGAMRCLLT